MAVFTEEEGSRLVALHGLSPETLTTWRFRQAIPDKFFKPGYIHRHKVKTVTPVEGLKLNRLCQVLGNEKLYRERIGALAELDKTMTLEFIKGRAKLHEDERLRLTKVIQQLRNDIKNAIGEPIEILSHVRKRAIFEIATDDRLKKKPLFGAKIGHKTCRATVAHDRLTFDKFSETEYEQILDSFYILLLETTL